MSVWNAILQASHSSLIDTLNENYPDDKLELGLPKRFDAWGTTEGADHFIMREVNSGQETGLLALGLSEKDAKTGEAIFKQMMVRIEKEFKLRKVDATLGKALAKAPSLRMTIWLPIRIVKKSSLQIFDLAVGI